MPAQTEWPAGMRGINVKPFVNYKDEYVKIGQTQLKQISSWKINLLRVHLGPDPGSVHYESSKRHNGDVRKFNDNIESIEDSYEMTFEGLETILNYCEKNNIRVIPSLSSPLHRYSDAIKFRKHFREFWIYFEKKYGSFHSIIGYDLLNEPNTDFEKIFVNKLYQSAIASLDSLDSKKFYIIEPFKNGRIKDIDNLSTTILNHPKTVISVHFYEPLRYTFQRVNYFKDSGFVNYGTSSNNPISKRKTFGKDDINELFLKLESLSKKFNKPILVGEFSVMRGSPGWDQWLTDVVEAMEKFNYSWTYHAYFTDFSGWNPTFAEEAPLVKGYNGRLETKRLLLLKSYWDLN